MKHVIQQLDFQNSHPIKKVLKEFDGFGDFGEKSYLLSIIWTGTCPIACELGSL